MTAKEYLSQAIGIKMRLDAMAVQLDFLKSAAISVTPCYNGLPKPANRNIHRNEDAILRILEFEEKMAELQAELSGICAVISAVTDPAAHTVLVKRYMEGKPWRKIASELHISDPQTYRLHNDALAKIEILIVNESN